MPPFHLANCPKAKCGICKAHGHTTTSCRPSVKLYGSIPTTIKRLEDLFSAKKVIQDHITGLYDQLKSAKANLKEANEACEQATAEEFSKLAFARSATTSSQPSVWRPTPPSTTPQ